MQVADYFCQPRSSSPAKQVRIWSNDLIHRVIKVILNVRVYMEKKVLHLKRKQNSTTLGIGYV